MDLQCDIRIDSSVQPFDGFHPIAKSVPPPPAPMKCGEISSGGPDYGLVPSGEVVKLPYG